MSHARPAPLPLLDTPVSDPRPRRPRLRRALRHPGLLVGGSICLLLVLAAVFAPWIAPHGPYDQDVTRRLADPIWGGNGSWTHPLGTDSLGRDLLSRIIYGTRTSLFISVTASVIAAAIGALLGTVGGYYGGRVDACVLYLINVKLALPIMLVALAVISITSSSIGVLIAILGLLTWDRYALVTRTLATQMREREFVQAARAAGASDLTIILREMLPNLMDQIIVLFTLEIAILILIEAALSFLGLGVPPPTPSWGGLVAEGRSMMFFKPPLVILPGLVILVSVIAINLAGDGLRDLTAPENRA